MPTHHCVTPAVIITQLVQNASHLNDRLQSHHNTIIDNGVGVDNQNISLATTVLTTVINYFNNTELHENDTFSDLPQIPAYIRTTSMVFCVTIMLLGVIGNVMVRS